MEEKEPSSTSWPDAPNSPNDAYSDTHRQTTNRDEQLTSSVKKKFSEKTPMIKQIKSPD